MIIFDVSFGSVSNGFISSENDLSQSKIGRYCIDMIWVSGHYNAHSLGKMINMMTSSNGNIFSRYWPFCGENHQSPVNRLVTRRSDVFFDLRLNKRLSTQSWGWWLNKPSHSLWRHCNEVEKGPTLPWMLSNPHRNACVNYFLLYTFVKRNVIPVIIYDIPWSDDIQYVTLEFRRLTYPGWVCMYQQTRPLFLQINACR